MKKTYWLYRGSEVLTAVRAPEGSNDDHVRYLAAASHQRIPLCHPDYTPYEFTRLLLDAEVRTDGDPKAPLPIRVTKGLQ